MKIKPRTLWITAVTLVLVAGVLWMLPVLVRSLSYKEVFPRQFPTWQGVINVWQVSTWRVARSSKSIQIGKAAKDYEKRNMGLFIEVENISEETYRTRLASGQQPDMLSFPAEMQVDLSPCVPIQLDRKLLSIHQRAYVASDKKAVPWLSTMPLIIVNADLASRRGVDYVDEFTWEYFESISKKMETSKDPHSWRGSACTMVGAIYADKSIDPPMAQTPWEAFISFSQREDPMMWGGLWEMAAMERQNDRGKGFTTAVKLPPTDIPTLSWSQNFCVYGGDDARCAMAVDFINVMLGDKVQQNAVEATNCMAVVPLEKDYSDVRKDLLAIEDMVAIIPGSGLDKETILRALGGDSEARARVIHAMVYQKGGGLVYYDEGVEGE